MNEKRTPSVRAASFAIQSYQKYLSPLLGKNCIYEPSCSQYAKEAIERYGVAKGSVLAAKRLGRCHPFHQGGFDPVP